MAETSGLGGWVVDLVGRVGEPGVGLLVAAENVFPPIPSEVILPFAGFSAAEGVLNPYLAWFAATLGALLGAYALYAVGALVSYERLHHLAGKRWFVLFGREDLARGHRFFDSHGGKVVLLGRLLPLVRSVVSVPAGVSRMPLVQFTALTVLGSGIWNALFITLGYQLGPRWPVVQEWLGPVGTAVVAALGLGLVVLVVRQVRRRV